MGSVRFTKNILICILIAFTVSICLIEIGDSDIYVAVDSEGQREEFYFDYDKPITTYSREDGSGIKAQVIEYMNISDKSNIESLMTVSDDDMISRVASNRYGIGYTTLSNIGEKVDTFAISGTYPTVDNLKNGEYKFTCPFYLVYGTSPVGLMEDFLRFVESPQGYSTMSSQYICEIDTLESFESRVTGGKIIIEGASSMVPIMEELAQAYKEYNPTAKIIINPTNSEAGILQVMNSNCDIAMIDRELTEDELEEVYYDKIAEDAIVIIKNHSNKLDSLTKEQVIYVFSGVSEKWKDLKVEL